jgi:hypothetical protein
MQISDREAQAAALLHSPLGTFVVQTVAAERSRQCEVAPQDFHVRMALRQYHADLETNATALFDLVVACAVDLSPYLPEYPERVHALAAKAPLMWEDALHLLNLPAADTWFADIERTRQVWVAPRDVVERLQQVPDNTDLTQFGGGIPKPRSAIWTTTAISSGSSGWLTYLRIGEDGRPPPYRQWRVEVLASARVYEVHGPDSWRSLCLSYPGPVLNGRLVPDWHAVGHDWDGIHLSTGGLLTAERVAVGATNPQTELKGWGCESTVWLGWFFGKTERLPDVLF